MLHPQKLPSLLAMDVSQLDSSPGRILEAQVGSLFGSSVTSSSPDDSSSFWLLAAFSRSRFKLHSVSVGSILQSILGGSADDFAVVEIEDAIYKFSVVSKSVGLFIYRLNYYACHLFKVFFHLWNDNGISFARCSTLSDSGPQYDWKEVKNKKSNRKASLIPVKRGFKRILSDLASSGGSAKQSVFSRLDFNSVPDKNFVANPIGSPRVQNVIGPLAPVMNMEIICPLI